MSEVGAIESQSCVPSLFTIASNTDHLKDIRMHSKQETGARCILRLCAGVYNLC